MDEFNFAIASFAVVVGVGVTDLAQSLHRLLTSRVVVRWAALPLFAAAYLGLVLSSIWFQLWLMKGMANDLGFWSLTGLLAQALLVYLAAAAALPDRPGRDSDLSAYYWRHRSNIWLPMAIYGVSSLGYSLYLNSRFPNYQMTEWDWVWRIGPLPLYVVLNFSRRHWVHAIGLVALTSLLIKRTADWSL